MKPKTEIQKLSVKLYKKRRGLTEAQRKYAYDHCFKKIGSLCKGVVWCSECGHEHVYNGRIPSEYNPVYEICPNCNKKIEIQQSRRGKLKQEGWFSVLTQINGVQLIESYQVSMQVEKNGRAYKDMRLVLVEFFDKEGHKANFSRGYDYWGGMLYFSHKPMELRERTEHDVYSIVYPRVGLIPELKRTGLKGKNYGCNIAHLVEALLKHNWTEMLFKMRQLDMLKELMYRGCYVDRLIRSIIVANRHGYMIENAGLWIDHVIMLENMGKDILNPKYICPKCLRDAHSELIAQNMKLEKKHRLAEEKKRWKEEDEEYAKEKGCFFGLVIENKNLTIKPLESIEEFYNEGKTMHHCVYSRRYYEDKDALILSARDKNNNRVETVEVNLTQHKIIQSRAICNGESPLHDEIIELVNKNMNRIIKRIAI